MAKLELDFVVAEGESTDEAATHFASGIGVVHSVVTEHGPAGGNPVILWQGTREQLGALAERYAHGSGEDTSFFLGQIQD